MISDRGNETARRDAGVGSRLRASVVACTGDYTSLLTLSEQILFNDEIDETLLSEQPKRSELSNFKPVMFFQTFET